MNVVTFTLLYQVICIFVFTCIYYIIGETNFSKQKSKFDNPNLTLLDYLFYSLTIQATIGLPDISADSQLSKFIVAIHQLFVMMTPVIIIDFLIKK